MAGDRTEQATPQRREKARREGDLHYSRELSSTAGTLGGILMLAVAGPRFVNSWIESLSAFMSYGNGAAWEPQTSDATTLALIRLAMTVLEPVGLVGAAVAMAALGTGALQTGGIQIHPQVLGFKLGRINPIDNLKGLVSLRSLARLGKSMIPAGLLAILAAKRIVREWNIPVFSTFRFIALKEDVYGLLQTAGLLLFGWAVIDYAVEWRSREQRLKMSRQDMREEYKDSEGNPQIRARIRNLQRQSRRRRVQADVSKAAVVVTNPTHYAVALAFDFEIMDAPKVLAKGRNLLAEEIKDQARWAGVPILENPPLARSLYRSVETGQSIPTELYAAVASILAFLYRQRVERQVVERRVRSESIKGQKNQHGSNAPQARDTSADPGTDAAVIPVISGLDRNQETSRSPRSATSMGPKTGHELEVRSQTLPEAPNDRGGL